MKNIIVSLTIFVSSLFASNFNTFEEIFFSNIDIEKVDEYKKYREDKNYKKIALYFTDKNKMYQAEFNIGDPHQQQLRKKIKRYMPNWVNIFTQYYNNAIKNNNPISANAALAILKGYLGKAYDKDYIHKRYELAKVLYEHNYCNGFLEYGDIIKNGISVAPNKELAKQIYTKGLKFCTRENSWEKNLIELKINNLE